MKQLGLYSKLSKKFKVTTNSKHNHFVVPNILKREFTVKEPSKAWVSALPISKIVEVVQHRDIIKKSYRSRTKDFHLRHIALL